MNKIAKITLLCCLLLPLMPQASRADGFEIYWGHGRDFHRHRPMPGYNRDLGLWRGGYWAHGWHAGRDGWWWVVGDRWHMYGAPVYPYPNIYAAPVYVAPVVVEQQTQPQVYISQPQPTTTIVTAPAPTTIVTTPSPATGSVVHFNETAPAAPIEVTAKSPTFVNSKGQTCREYQTTIEVDGAKKSATGTACLQSDGSWRVTK